VWTGFLPRVASARADSDVFILLSSDIEHPNGLKGSGASILPRSTGSVDQLPDSGQVMVVVLGHKIQMIHKPHGLLQTWM
jgi:hypothetical protein